MNKRKRLQNTYEKRMRENGMFLFGGSFNQPNHHCWIFRLDENHQLEHRELKFCCLESMVKDFRQD